MSVAGSLTSSLRPTLVPLGDSALLLRFADMLDEHANRAAIAFARALDVEPIAGLIEVAPNLVSVLLRYDPCATTFDRLAGEARLRLARSISLEAEKPRAWTISVVFDGEDIDHVSAALDMDRAQFIAAHNASSMRVLATGFAPGFVYCGLHPKALTLPRRTAVRPSVAAGSVLFAAGQTAITATAMPTGWHLIGHTTFRNFDPNATQPTRLAAGDDVVFAEAT